MKPVLVAMMALVPAPPALAQPAPEAVAEYGAEEAARELLVQGTTDISHFAPTLDGFLDRTPDTRIRYEQWASNDLYDVSMENCRAGQTGADLLISSAVDLMVKFVNDGCAQPHLSATTEALPDDAHWRHEIFGTSSEPAVMIYNTDHLPVADAPKSRFDLIDLLRREEERFMGRIATYDIEASGLGYFFAFADSQQATTFGSMLAAFDRAGVVATCCSAEIIDGVISGQYYLAYNVLGSYALERAEQVDNLAIVAPSDYTLVLSRAATIPGLAADPGLAGRLIDFMLSDAGRAALAEKKLYIDIDAEPSGHLRIHSDNPAALRPIRLSPGLLVGLDRHKRERFLQIWQNALSVTKGRR